MPDNHQQIIELVTQCFPNRDAKFIQDVCERNGMADVAESVSNAIRLIDMCMAAPADSSIDQVCADNGLSEFEPIVCASIDAIADGIDDEFAITDASDFDEPSFSLPGRLAGKYTLTEQLGKGGFGYVFLGVEDESELKVAIKLARHDRVQEVDAFRAEATSISNLRHAHIVRLYAFGEDEGQWYLVYELIEGRSLSKVLSTQKKFDAKEAASIVSQIASALHEAHRNGVYHRDVKPSNILIETKSGSAFLTDFGIALNTQSKSLAQQGVSPPYMSPEQAKMRYDQVDGRTDIFSLGVVFYEMLVGERPFSGNYAEITKLLSEDNDVAPLRQRTDVPEDLDRICRAALKKDPNQRFQTAQDFADALDEFLSGERQLNEKQIKTGLENIKHLLPEYAPTTRKEFRKNANELTSLLHAKRSELPAESARHRDQLTQYVEQFSLEVFDSPFYRIVNGYEIPPPIKQCPFPGLRPFDEQSSSFFFGREQLVKTMIEDRLEYQDCICLAGPSGSGKSSIALAGLLPAMRELGYSIVLTSPTTDLVNHLEELLPEVHEEHVFLVIDQFERLASLDETSQRTLIEWIHQSRQQRANLKTALTVRTDYLSVCQTYRSLSDFFNENKGFCFVKPLSIPDLTKAVQLQASEVGLRFEADLMEKIFNDVEGESGAMPLIQHALALLWEHRRGRNLKKNAYLHEIRGVKRAIQQSADSIYKSASESEQQLIEHIFRRLTHLDSDSQRSSRKEELESLIPANIDQGVAMAVVNRLVDAKLLVTDEDSTTNTVYVEVAHETLIEKWERLRDWLSENLEQEKLVERIRERAIDWSQDKDRKKLVLPDKDLAAASELLNQVPTRLDASEERFVLAAKRQLEWNQRIRVLVFLGVFVLLLFLTVSLFRSNGRLEEYVSEFAELPFVHSLETGQIKVNDLNQLVRLFDNLSEHASQESQSVSAFWGLGLIYETREDYPKAIEKYQTALDQLTSQDVDEQRLLVSKIQNRIAGCKAKEVWTSPGKLHDRAPEILGYFDKVIQLRRELVDSDPSRLTKRYFSNALHNKLEVLRHLKEKEQLVDEQMIAQLERQIEEIGLKDPLYYARRFNSLTIELANKPKEYHTGAFLAALCSLDACRQLTIDDPNDQDWRKICGQVNHTMVMSLDATKQKRPSAQLDTTLPQLITAIIAALNYRNSNLIGYAIELEEIIYSEMRGNGETKGHIQYYLDSIQNRIDNDAKLQEFAALLDEVYGPF